MVLGHQKQREFLRKSAEIGKLSHAYLFAGEEYLGKRKMAMEWASSLLKEDLAKGVHPDLILIGPEAEKKEIHISQIRDLIWKLSLKPYSAPLKIAIIDRAHLMNEEAQNCFLKTLEEPKDKTLIILITEAAETLLPTILSRCERIKFYPVKRKEIENYLKSQGVLEKEIQKIADISLGRPGVAINFLETPQKLEERAEKIKEIVKISNSDLAFRFQYVKDLSQSPDLTETLNIWLAYFRSILIGKYLNSTFPLPKLKNILKVLQDTNFLISNTNVNSRLALEILMLAI